MFLTDFLWMARHPREISLGNCCSIVAFSLLSLNFWAPLCLLYVSPSFALGEFILFHFGQLFLDLTRFPNFVLYTKTRTQFPWRTFPRSNNAPPTTTAAPLFPRLRPLSPSLSPHFPEADNNNVKQLWGIDKGRLLTSRQSPQDGQNYAPLLLKNPLQSLPHLAHLILSRRCTPHGSKSDKAATVESQEKRAPYQSPLAPS